MDEISAIHNGRVVETNSSHIVVFVDGVKIRVESSLNGFDVSYKKGRGERLNKFGEADPLGLE